MLVVQLMSFADFQDIRRRLHASSSSSCLSYRTLIIHSSARGVASASSMGHGASSKDLGRGTEMVEVHGGAEEDAGLAEGLQLCKNCMISELRNAADVVRSEAWDAKRARMPIRSRPELVLKWAMQEMKSPNQIQRARWGCMLGIMPPRMPHHHHGGR